MQDIARGNRVLVTGLGVISPLGPDTDANLRSLLEGKDCVAPIEIFDVSRTRCKTAGQIPDVWLEKAFPPGRVSDRFHRGARMAALALREASKVANGAKPELMVVGTTVGGMSYGELFYRRLLATKSRKGFARLVGNYTPQKPIQDALELNRLRIPTQILTNACSSGSNAIGHGFELVRHGLRSCVVCGGYEPLCELVFVGFDSLQAATPEKIRPFDRNRTGLVLGEGAAFLILESERSANSRGAVALAEMVGYGVSTDTYHLTQPNPSGIGPKLAMQRALDSGGVAAGAIDYVNAHGTATIFNDATEGAAISELCGKVPVSSTKSMMGHALGAAGAIEAAFCVLALRDQFLPPNINFVQPDPAWKFEVVANQFRAARVNYALSNSIGFGGTNATLILKQT
ncbi:MAG: beta-ketoacyl-[acyl-carrier-protein] synthase family protein [Verrucomicrobia bacterium]|nr:beta-ketoacyl-[acyl-carrier-protein] synthase family protein [Verrucomicrobiota bacterium]MBV9129616.1 beta-ketoacyl-[acyl-carrier-protein] synthase family protein [Verrucomicrobiota bacterium]